MSATPQSTAQNSSGLPSHYTQLAKVLHWLVAGLIISQYVLAKLAQRAEDHDQLVQQLGLLANHKSIGMTVLLLAVIRLGWRFFNKTPQLPESMPTWQKKASNLSHVLLYGLIFAIPISGWLMSSATAYSVSWFNLFAFPDLVAPSKSLANTFHEAHHLLVELLFVLALIHIGAALKHHFFDKDDILTRMSSALGWIVLFAAIAVGIGVFGRVAVSKTEAEPGSTESLPLKGEQLAEPALVMPESELISWVIDYDASHIKFSGVQAGAPFEGEWQRWQADLKFDENNLQQSRFSVDIEIASVFSNDDTRDETIVGADFFDIENFAHARFVANDFSATENNSYIAKSSLTMKGVSKPVEFTFTVDQQADSRVLVGSATLNRFEWEIGMGDWVDTSWVGQDVVVDVKVVVKP